MKARRRRPPLGQHFLQDPSWRRRILEQLSIKREDFWLEIGAGHGEFTFALAESSRGVAAVERDAGLAAALREQLLRFPYVRVIEADILRLDLASLARERGAEKLRVYGSLPYYITSPILRRLFGSLAVIEDIYVIVQREVAERLVAKPHGRDYGFLSALTQLHTEPEMMFVVPRGAFRPAPKVDSALVRLAPPGARTRLQLRDTEEFVGFLGACFRLKRKTLRNNLRRALPVLRVEEALKEAGHAPQARAEELSVEELAGLYSRLKGRGEE